MTPKIDRKYLVKIVISAILIAFGLIVISYGWLVFDQIDIDKGGTFALTGAFLLLIGIGLITYKYEFRRKQAIEMESAQEDSN